jgi:hypothetical protein
MVGRLALWVLSNITQFRLWVRRSIALAGVPGVDPAIP